MATSLSHPWNANPPRTESNAFANVLLGLSSSTVMPTFPSAVVSAAFSAVGTSSACRVGQERFLRGRIREHRIDRSRAFSWPGRREPGRRFEGNLRARRQHQVDHGSRRDFRSRGNGLRHDARRLFRGNLGQVAEELVDFFRIELRPSGTSKPWRTILAFAGCSLRSTNSMPVVDLVVLRRDGHDRSPL